MKKKVSAALLLVLGSGLSAVKLPVVPIHVTIISDKDEAVAEYKEENFQWIADTLNEEFKDQNGGRLADFKIVSRTPLDEAKEKGASLFGIEDQNQFSKMFPQLIQTALYQKDKLNVFIYHNPKGNMLSNGGTYCTYDKKTAAAGEKVYNACYTRILLHWKVLTKQNKRVLLHEAGHSFGLHHVVAASDPADNNVMTAADNAEALPAGEKGYYFTPSQVRTIDERMRIIQKTFAQFR